MGVTKQRRRRRGTEEEKRRQKAAGIRLPATLLELGFFHFLTFTPANSSPARVYFVRFKDFQKEKERSRALFFFFDQKVSSFFSPSTVNYVP